MLIVKIEQEENGAHENQTCFQRLSKIPEGWAEIPDGTEIPKTFPFVNIKVDGKIVTEILPGIVPEEPEPDPIGPPETQVLGREITDLSLEQIAMGQEITELQLMFMEGGKAVV